MKKKGNKDPNRASSGRFALWLFWCSDRTDCLGCSLAFLTGKRRCGRESSETQIFLRFKSNCRRHGLVNRKTKGKKRVKDLNVRTLYGYWTKRVYLVADERGGWWSNSGASRHGCEMCGYSAKHSFLKGRKWKASWGFGFVFVCVIETERRRPRARIGAQYIWQVEACVLFFLNWLLISNC